MGFVASTGGSSAGMIRDLRLDCVERRLAAPVVSRSVEWLRDNFGCFTAHGTVRLAAELCLLAFPRP